MQAQNRTHRNFEPPGVQHHNAEESHQQGNNEVDNREPVHMIFRDIVVPSSEVRYGGKGQPHLRGEGGGGGGGVAMVSRVPIDWGTLR